jgi:NAD(P)-dependent dehydrogenase (short-subunit alcohol dehydrogenase family)
LINNAGIGPDSDLLLPEIESFRQTFEVNTTGTVFFTEAILKLMSDNGKIVNISSKMGSIELCSDIDSVAYRMSKTALNMYAKILANRLSGKQIVATIHPGWVRTELAESNINAPLSAEESAAKIFKFVTDSFENGTFWNVDTDSKLNW